MIENQTFERKRQYCQNAKNTLLAFLNTDGGVLCIGIDDDGSVYGIEGDIDEEARRVTTSFRDSVTPDPSGHFKVETETREGRHVIVVTVRRGSAIPYCYTAYGLVPQGVYVRVGSNTVMATREHIRRMIKDNSAGQFLAELSNEQNLTFDAAGKVFADSKVAFGNEQKQSLGLIRPDGWYTNLALVLSDQCPYTTKAAIFEGLGKERFKDRKEFTGSLFKQIEETTAYLRVYNRIRGTIEGLYRVDYPDYPDVAIREAYVNAVIHRDYSLAGSVLVSLFDNRLEFMSLGGMMPGVTHDLMLAGVSVARNEKLAHILYRLEIIEAYGTGIPRIFEAYENAAVKPEIPVVNGGFLLRLPNRNYAAPYAVPDAGYASVVRESPVSYGSNAHYGSNTPYRNSAQQTLAVFAGRWFGNAEAAAVLCMTVYGTQKLLQRMAAKGLLAAEKEGNKWAYRVISPRPGERG